MAKFEPTVEQMETAISTLLTDYVEQRESPRGTADVGKSGLMLPSEVWSDGDVDLRFALSDPLRWALWNAIHALGTELHKIHKAQRGFGISGLVESAEAIAARDKQRADYRESLLDKIFDGIGEGSDVWMA